MSSPRPELLDAVAIVGMACRFPGAPTVEAFWDNLCGGVESIRRFSAEELRAAGMPAEVAADPDLVPANGSLDDVESFDAAFFDMSPRVAEITDPQQRLFLECVWEAFERAGHDPARSRKTVGVWAGESLNAYLLRNIADPRFLGSLGELQTAVGNRTDHLATSVAYKLDLRGPAVTVQTTCSTALVAVHLASQALLNHQCAMAVAGGVRVQVPQATGYAWQAGGIFSRDGHCRPFDAAASGTVNGSGAGAVVLKRLEDALADGDTVHAVLRGSAINNDGAGKIGYTAPSVDGQARVIALAQAVAGVDPDSIGFVEAHGTGTPLGDPIEVAALTRVFRQKTERRGFCALGAVKSNLGHLDTAAGAAGLIKAALALERGTIPPTLHFERPSPELKLEESPFFVPREAVRWERENGSPRRAGVSSFGIGGTNAHLVLEEPPATEPSGPSRPWQMLLLSARTSAALEAATENLARHLEERVASGGFGDRELADSACTLQTGRRAFEYRRAVVCRNAEEAISLFRRVDPRRVVTSLQEPRQRRVAFLFPGQGAQHPGMAAALYDTEPLFRGEIDRCAELLRESLDGIDLRRAALDPAASPEQLRDTAIAQPALFAVEWSLARLWRSWGVEPAAMLGHSIGEWVAATVAGVFRLEDALALVAERGRLVASLPAGTMLSVHLPESELAERLEAAGIDLEVAAVNRPGVTVVAGREEEVGRAEAALVPAGVALRRLHTSHAFHSRMMEPVVDALSAAVARVERRPPELPWISNPTGDWIAPEQATDPEYWGRHLRQPVRFGAGAERLLRDDDWLFLEVGPGTGLSTLLRQHPARGTGSVVQSSLPHSREERAADEALITALGRLWLAGQPIDWDAFYEGERRRRAVLPTYPFERRRHWFEPAVEARADGSRARAGVRSGDDPADWLWTATWQRSAPPALFRTADGGRERLAAGLEAERWLLFVDDTGLGDALADRLESAGKRVVRVRAAESAAPDEEPLRRDGSARLLAPTDTAAYEALLDAAAGDAGGAIERIVHLWTVGATFPDGDGGRRRLEELGWGSLQRLGRAIGRRGLDGLVLGVVTEGMQEVVGGDLGTAEAAMVLGPCLVLPGESAAIACRSIDLDPRAAGGRSESERTACVDRLLIELGPLAPAPGGADDGTAQVAYRGGHRWVRAVERVPVPEPRPDELPLRDRGVYLITGGLGGMGLTFAAHLAHKVAARLVLVGRTGLPPRSEWDRLLAEDDASGGGGAGDRRTAAAIRAVREIEAAGGEVLAAAADVADREAVAEVLERARERFGPVQGVIHAAGVAPGGLLQMSEPEAAGAGLAAKVHGTRVLDDLLGKEGEPLDFFLVCSSRSVLLAPPGAADYVAANSFLDAFVLERNARRERGEVSGGPAVAVDWCAWRGVGMLEDAASATLSADPVEAPPGVEQPLDHPLLDRRWVADDGRETVETVFSPRTHWVLDEHRISGHAVLVGTIYLELARAALAVRGDHGPLEVSDVFFLNPVRLRDDEARAVRLVLDPREDGAFDFHAASRLTTADGRVTWERAMMGTIGPLRDPAEAAAAAPAVDPAAVRSRSSLDPSMAAVEQELREDLGPRWQTVRQVHRGDGEVLGLLELAEEWESDVEEMLLHPALLDRAVSLGVNYLADDLPDEFFLPMSYRRLVIHEPLPRRILAWVRRLDRDLPVRETISFAITLLDESGRVLVDIDRFSRKRVGDAWAQLRSMVAKEGAEGPAAGADGTGGADGADPGGSPDGAAGRLREALDAGIDPEEGCRVLDRALAAAAIGRLIVSPDDLPAAIDAALHRRGLAALDEVAELSADTPRHERPDLGNPYVDPESPLEETLARIWGDVLGVGQVGAEDNFFELGGDSVLGVQVIARAKKEGVDVAPAQLFELQTVRALAARIEESAGDAPEGGTAGGDEAAPAPVAAGQLDKLAGLLARADGRGGGNEA